MGREGGVGQDWGGSGVGGQEWDGSGAGRDWGRVGGTGAGVGREWCETRRNWGGSGAGVERPPLSHPLIAASIEDRPLK